MYRHMEIYGKIWKDASGMEWFKIIKKTLCELN